MASSSRWNSAICPTGSGTYEDYVGERGLEKRGLHKWRHHVGKVIELLVAALEPDETVIGGGNAEKLDELPPNCRVVTNDNAFIGGFRLWEPSPSPNQNARRLLTTETLRPSGPRNATQPRSRTCNSG